ncbi:MAG: deoxyribodipyrimidine photo-lyase [Patescibacteria group bacterium]
MERSRKLNNKEIKTGEIVYWMSRDQRVHNNHALLYAQQTALFHKQPLTVLFGLTQNFPGAYLRHYDFMLKGLKEVEQELSKFNIKFVLIEDSPDIAVLNYCDTNKVGAVFTDYSPLKISKKWKTKIQRSIECALIEVDAHNVVPVWETSNKQEYAARTIRPKIQKLLPMYLVEYPKLKKHPFGNINNKTKWPKITADKEVKPVEWIVPGEYAAQQVLTSFKKNISNYNKNRNDPTKKALSNLSPYLHFGQISAQQIALEINEETFLEELIIRKELADNFCEYNSNYDNINGFPTWAKETLAKHKNDSREYVYSIEEFEKAKTHDPAWNAAQLEMVSTGKMHGYMRMYWCKKILEWTPDPAVAMKIALYLNDKYELDGRDPNGYTGIAWSIGGVHDRPWFEREVFGTIRYMNFNGLKRKFNVERYIEQVNS